MDAVVVLILLGTMAFFVSLDYVQERRSLIRARAEQLAAIGAMVQASLGESNSEPVMARLQALASSRLGEAVTVYFVENPSVATLNNDAQSELGKLERIVWITNFEAWKTPAGLAVSIPFSSFSTSSTTRIFVEASTERVEAALARTLRIHVVHGLVTVAAMAFGIAWLLRTALLGPLRRILSAINVIERGTWEVDVPIPRGDEMAALTAAFNKVGRNLASTVHQFVQAEKLSLLALLAIQVRQGMDAPLRDIEKTAFRLGMNSSLTPREARHEVERIREASERARRAAQRLDQAFSEALGDARSSTHGKESSTAGIVGPAARDERKSSRLG
jgi:methyl-accepting chemotaxis protein